jgi:hypothetical protein
MAIRLARPELEGALLGGRGISGSECRATTGRAPPLALDDTVSATTNARCDAVFSRLDILAVRRLQDLALR